VEETFWTFSNSCPKCTSHGSLHKPTTACWFLWAAPEARPNNFHTYVDYKTTIFCSNVLRASRSIKDAGLVGCVWIGPGSFEIHLRLFLYWFVKAWISKYVAFVLFVSLNCNVLLWTVCRKEEICYSQLCRLHSKFGNASTNNLFWLYTALFYEWDEVCWSFGKSNICLKVYYHSRRS
jgi:hypothetical protein